MRSKLLTLRLVHNTLSTHTALLLDPTAFIYSSTTGDGTPFVDSVKQYLFLSLNRNAVNSVPQVFETSLEIFWQILANLRARVKVRVSFMALLQI